MLLILLPKFPSTLHGFVGAVGLAGVDGNLWAVEGGNFRWGAVVWNQIPDLQGGWMCLGKIRRRFEDFKSGGVKARAAWGIYCQVCLPKMILHTWHILSQAYWTEAWCRWKGAEEGGRIWTRRKSSRQLCRLRGRRIRCGGCGSTSDQRQDEIDRWFKRVIQ